jgi:hypothetical protein
MARTSSACHDCERNADLVIASKRYDADSYSRSPHQYLCYILTFSAFQY